MSRPLVVLRPEPGAGMTARRAVALGLTVLCIPLFAVEGVAVSPPAAAGFDAVLLTSANAARHGRAALEELRHLPLFAVGEATARALREAGHDPVVGAGTAARIYPLIARQGHRQILHLCGEDVRPADSGALSVMRHIVYRAVPTDPDEARSRLMALPPAAVLVHSPRAGERLCALLDQGRRACHRVVAISAAAAAAAGDGWGQVGIAQQPDDPAMLALAADLCQSIRTDRQREPRRR